LAVAARLACAAVLDAGDVAADLANARRVRKLSRRRGRQLNCSFLNLMSFVSSSSWSGVHRPEVIGLSIGLVHPVMKKTVRSSKKYYAHDETTRARWAIG